jgi:hypothetical protein
MNSSPYAWEPTDSAHNEIHREKDEETNKPHRVVKIQKAKVLEDSGERAPVNR